MPDALLPLFRQLFDPASSTYTYLLGCRGSRAAVLIDPVRDQLERDLALLTGLGLELHCVLDTHVHADHVTAAGALADATGAAIVAGAGSGLACADRLLDDGDELRFGAERLSALATPGHTSGCTSYLWRDRVFTGDALLIGSCGRTDFQEGDAGKLWQSLTGKLYRLPGESLVYPAHDYHGRRVSSIDQERAGNEFTAGRDRDGFVAALNALQLAPPKLLDVAVPANRRCGRDG
ncbi:MAG TPA: MBL fold metallo-hydrolase [Gammaproteobacteria bacterium]